MYFNLKADPLGGDLLNDTHNWRLLHKIYRWNAFVAAGRLLQVRLKLEFRVLLPVIYRPYHSSLTIRNRSV